MYNIVIVGAGQIGSRHLQALTKIDRKVSIYVVDPNVYSIFVAQQRFNEVYSSLNVDKIRYLVGIEELPENLDVVIVATHAGIRKKVIAELVEKKTIKYLLLEKVLFQKIEDYFYVESLLNSNGIKTWVNCPRRVFPIYKELKRKIKNSLKLNINISGSDWGLACNGIHYIDLLSYLTGELKYQYNIDKIDPGFINSKRQGFWEITGSLIGQSRVGYEISMTSYRENNLPALITIECEEFRGIIRENEGKYWISERSNEWIWQEKSFSIMYQSQITHLIVQNIFDNGECDLPSYHDSIQLHIPFIQALTAHFKIYSEEYMNICPIT